MVDDTLLLSLLQFIALLAPAIAFLMQIVLRLDDSDVPSRPASFKLLQFSLICTIIGGLLISSRLIAFVSDPLILIGSGLMILALLLLPIAILLIDSGWRFALISIPNRDGFKTNQVIPVLSILFPALLTGAFLSFVYWVMASRIDRYIQYGFFRDYDLFSPSLFYGVIILLMAIWIMLQLWEEGYIPDTGVRNAVSWASIISIGSLFIYLILQLPFYGVAFALLWLEVSELIVDL